MLNDVLSGHNACLRTTPQEITTYQVGLQKPHLGMDICSADLRRGRREG